MHPPVLTALIRHALPCRPALLAVALLSALPSAFAAPPAAYAMVDAVQAPAWVVRQGRKQALAPGQTLKNNDRLLTGDDGRALVQLGDGSAVKVGANGEVKFNALGRKDNKVFTAALDVASGAFRLTTDAFQRKQQQRAINVRVSTVTAGIRGTDIWGKSDGERDLICLLEGKITVSHPLGEAVSLSEPASFYYALKGQAPAPVGKVDADELARWASQTEMTKGQGAARRGGQWKVILAKLDKQSAALDLLDRSRAAGFASKVYPVKAAAGYAYEVRLEQLANEEEAGAVGQRARTALDLTDDPQLRRR